MPIDSAQIADPVKYFLVEELADAPDAAVGSEPMSPLEVENVEELTPVQVRG